MQRATFGKSGGSFAVTRSDNESIFQQQFDVYHGYDGCYSTYFDSSTIVKADFLSSQKPLAASSQVLAGSWNNFLSSYGFYNLMNIGLAGLSNRDS